MDLPAQFGKYLLVHRVGSGGMAELFLAKQTGLKGFEKVLAIKKILPHLTQDPEFVSMFVNEGKLAALLTHQHIVQIFDLGHVDGAYYLAMEYVMGKDLRTVAARARERGGRLPIDHALSIVSRVASGLDYAHRKKDLNGRDLNIVHRDVSPQNVLVSYEGEVKLVDFGIAKAAGIGQETRTGILKGKLAYMSPEQAMGRAIDRRSDVFALGIVLYELLTGRRLFKGDSDLSTLEQVRTAHVDPPKQIDADIPDALEAAVMTALAREPDQRYQTAADFQAALETIIAQRGRGSSTLHLSQYMASLFADDQRMDNERLQSVHQETVRVSASPRSSVAPTRSQEQPRRRPPSRPAPRPEPPRERHPIRAALLGAVVLFLLGSGTVVATPGLLAWMRDQPDQVARVGDLLEMKLREVGLARLVPEPPGQGRSAPPQAGEIVVSTEAAAMAAAPPDAGQPPPPPPPEPQDQMPVVAAVPTPVAPPEVKVDRVQIRRMLRDARDLYAQGRLNEVEDVLRGVIEQDPNSPLAYHLLGTVYLERKEEERAFKIFSAAAHQFPRDSTLRYDLGFLYAERGLGTLAREELTRALALQPNGGLAERARLFLKTGTAGRPSGPPIDRVMGRPLLQPIEGGLPTDHPEEAPLPGSPLPPPGDPLLAVPPPPSADQAAGQGVPGVAAADGGGAEALLPPEESGPP
ncbi:MAG: protein kinase [Nitrospirota bacterium]